MGNTVLRSLLALGIAPQLIVTRDEPNAYPYYAQSQLRADADDSRIPCFTDSEGERALRDARPDILLVATYHRILREETYSAAGVALNFHPSLLPRYRGPNPYFWALRNGEAQTGLTVHVISDAPDAGDIVWQRAVAIELDDDQGRLRLRLSQLAALAVPEIVSAIADNRLLKVPQQREKSTFFGKPHDIDCTLDPCQDLSFNLRVARAAMPYPGALVDGIVADKVIAHWAESELPPKLPKTGPNRFLMRLCDGAILLSIRAGCPDRGP
jgi:methionyl-tRNA formyltransferase